jgi:hypothetical protein
MEIQNSFKAQTPAEKHLGASGSGEMSTLTASNFLQDIQHNTQAEKTLGCFSPGSMKHLPNIEVIKGDRNDGPNKMLNIEDLTAPGAFKKTRINDNEARIVNYNSQLNPDTPYNARVITDGVNNGARTEITYPNGARFAVPGSEDTVALSRMSVDTRTPPGRLGGTRVSVETVDGETHSFSYPNIKGAAQAAWSSALRKLSD